LIESYNGKSAWHQGADGEIATLLGHDAMEMEAAAQYYNARSSRWASEKLVLPIREKRKCGADPRRKWN